MVHSFGIRTPFLHVVILPIAYYPSSAGEAFSVSKYPEEEGRDCIIASEYMAPGQVKALGAPVSGVAGGTMKRGVGLCW